MSCMKNSQYFMLQRSALIVITIVLLFAGCGHTDDQPYDVLISGGLVMDGTGAHGMSVDVAITAGSIVAVGQLGDARGTTVIDAAGLIVAPGFIDIHTHSEYALLADGNAESKIRQGVTTEILGESGSPGPRRTEWTDGRYGITPDWVTLGGYFNRVLASGISVNIGSYVGSMQIRRYVMGDEYRAATPEEITQMQDLAAAAMRDGALGVATSLLGSPLTTEELIAMCSAVAPYQGIYSTHIRDEGGKIFEALDEAFRIGREAGVPVDVLHLKIAERKLWSRMNDVLARFEQARANGLQVTANMYPYIAGQNNLVALIPPWARDGGREAMLGRLRDPKIRIRLREALYGSVPGWYNHYTSSAGWESMLIVNTSAEHNKDLIGLRMNEVIARQSGKDPSDVLYDLLLEENGSVPTIYFLMTEEDVRTAMQSPLVSFGSDGTAVKPEGVLGRGRPHPRWYGTFPRILGKYVREEGVISLETAIHKMTWMNAEKLGLKDRGIIRKGMAADICIFDAERIIDRATFTDPHQYSEGVEYVLVNGEVVLERGRHTGRRPGQVLHGPGYSRE
ncbi:amidohydrolase family protein [candidate division KSB1 bacterium]